MCIRWYLKMKYLRKMISHYVEVTDSEWEKVSKKCVKKTLKKGDIVHYAGDVFSEIWFIRNGLARSYFTDAKGRDYTWQFYFRAKTKHGLNHVMDDSVSYYENEGSLLQFEILEDATFYVIGLAELDEIIRKEKKWEHLARVWLHDTYFTATYKRVISLMSETVEEKYKRLLKEYPTIFERVKSYHIASYLGMTPQTLSKLRKVK